MKFEGKVAKNSRLTCLVSGCQSRRSGVARYCRRHTNLNNKHGHPLGFNIKLKEHPMTVRLVERFLQLNYKSEGIQRSLEMLEDWMAKAAEGYAVAGGIHTTNLYQNRVKAIDIIEQAAVIYLLSHESEMIHLETPRGLNTAMGSKVLLLAPTRIVTSGAVQKRIRPTPKDKRKVGEFMMSNLGMLFASMKITIDKHKKKTEQREQAVRASVFTMETPHTLTIK